MSKELLPFCVDDVSALAKALRSRLLANETTPGHVELLNCLAKSAGFRNFQHFRANAKAQDLLAAPAAPSDPVDFAKLRALIRLFDATGRLTVWPSRRGRQVLCLWVLWSAVPARQVFDEPGITRFLAALHLFGDPAMLRRELCDLGLLTRTPDCRQYRRVERKPPAEAVALIHHLAAMADGGAGKVAS